MKYFACINTKKEILINRIESDNKMQLYKEIRKAAKEYHKTTKEILMYFVAYNNKSKVLFCACIENSKTNVLIYNGKVMI
jgi:hypothetical protein